jgi:3-oxoacyl-[acyl-carrier protein] reductase
MRMLDGKTAVIYGAAGGIGSATSKAFAREGAMVFITGRTQKPLELLADEISKSGGLVEIASVVSAGVKLPR